MEQDILLKEKFSKILPILNERQRRLYLASEALYIGRGGVAKVSILTGVSRITINSGVSDLRTTNQENIDTSSQKRVRKKGGGRKKKIELYHMQLYYDPKIIRKNIAVSANRFYLSVCSIHH